MKLLASLLSVRSKLAGLLVANCTTVTTCLAVSLLPWFFTTKASADILVGKLTVELQRVVDTSNLGTLRDPLDLDVPPDGSGRLFLAEQQGRIRICAGGTCTTALDIRTETYTPGANGLMGVTFHPGFANPLSPGYRKLYTQHTVAPATHPGATVDFPSPAVGTVGHHNVITEWQMSLTDPNVVDVSTRREVFRESHVGVLHNGGTLTWGKDGYLYGAIGTPADTSSQHLTAQDLSNMYGKMYRIDPLDPLLTVLDSDGVTLNPDAVSANGKYRIPADNPFVGAAGLDEIYASGFRHPYRFSVDSGTGRVFVGDVGQGSREEVSVVPAGANMGWPYREGTANFPPIGGADPPGLTDPIAEYDHGDGRSVIGGFVYHGSIEALQRQYIFGEFSWGTGGFNMSQGRLLILDPFDGNGNVKPYANQLIEEIAMGPLSCANTLNAGGDCTLDITLRSIAQDSAGELYLVGNRGASRMIVYKIVSAFVPEPTSLALLSFAMIPAALRRGRRVS